MTEAPATHLVAGTPGTADRISAYIDAKLSNGDAYQRLLDATRKQDVYAFLYEYYADALTVANLQLELCRREWLAEVEER